MVNMALRDSSSSEGSMPIQELLMRTVDFSDQVPIRQVTATLRRLWLLDPPTTALQVFIQARTNPISASSMDKSFQSTFHAISQSIAAASPGTRWDYTLWASQTNHSLLEAPLVTRDPADPNDKRGVYSPWRNAIYDTYKHVFFDLFRTLKSLPDMGYIGVFEPSHEKPVPVLILDGHGSSESSGTTFGTDTFMYPVWISRDTTVVFSAGNSDFLYDGNESSSWTVGLWFRGGAEVTWRMVSKDAPETVEEKGIVAVFALGPCEERRTLQLAEADQNAPIQDQHGPINHAQVTDEEDFEGLNIPEFVKEGDHLARAIFLRAGDAVELCTFDEIESSGTEGIEDEDYNHPSPGPLYLPFPDGKSIRVLVLAPGSYGELHTYLRIVSLRNIPTAQYEALSYTWGDPEDKAPLHVGSGSVIIPNNLHDALRRLRYPDRPRYIWADAVCINQGDIEERGQQVSIMREIYLKAARVLVWLGQDRRNQAAPAFQVVCDIVRSWRPLANPLSFSAYRCHFEPKGDILNLDDAGEDALRALFQNEYFTRFWVIQELVLGNSATVIWGEHHISWGLVGICATWILTKAWPVFVGKPLAALAYNAFLIYVLPLAKRSSISSFPRLDLSIVLATTLGKFNSTDPRDRIFALLGMPFYGNDPDSGGTLVVPDYKTDLRSVYISATRRMLARDGHLRILSAVQHGPEVDHSYPSWVPRWNEPLSAEPLALRSEQGFYANGGELFVPPDDDGNDIATFGADGESLILNGLLCATVTATTEAFIAGGLTHTTDTAATLALLRELNSAARMYRGSWTLDGESNVIPGFANPARQAALLADPKGFRMTVGTVMPGSYGMRMGVAKLTGDRMLSNNLGEFLLYWRERCTWNLNTLIDQLFGHPDFEAFWREVEGDDNPYVQERALCAINTFVGRRLLYFADGRVGLGPAAVRPGDVIAVLFGGIVPYVLRPLGDDGVRWTLVGECFVPWLMQGEAVEAAGLLAKGTFQRENNGNLRVIACKDDGSDPRLHRQVGLNGIQRFEIR